KSSKAQKLNEAQPLNDGCVFFCDGLRKSPRFGSASCPYKSTVKSRSSAFMWRLAIGVVVIDTFQW
ncbi:MAG: hypothetical protein ACI9DS_002347, partial [Glaciecola sp.]